MIRFSWVPSDKVYILFVFFAARIRDFIDLNVERLEMWTLMKRFQGFKHEQWCWRKQKVFFRNWFSQ